MSPAVRALLRDLLRRTDGDDLALLGLGLTYPDDFFTIIYDEMKRRLTITPKEDE